MSTFSLTFRTICVCELFVFSVMLQTKVVNKTQTKIHNHTSSSRKRSCFFILHTSLQNSVNLTKRSIYHHNSTKIGSLYLCSAELLHIHDGLRREMLSAQRRLSFAASDNHRSSPSTTKTEFAASLQKAALRLTLITKNQSSKSAYR